MAAFDHIADAIKAPAVVRLTDNLYVARFETMKVYSTLVAVERLLSAGNVRKGDTLIDSSSGLYAYALALACHRFGMKCHVVASKTVDRTLALQLEILGATVDRVPPSATLKLDQSLRVQRIQSLLQADRSMHWMQQYHDDIHYAGYEPVAKALVDAVGTDGLTVVGGVGSGCSTGGLIQQTSDSRHYRRSRQSAGPLPRSDTCPPRRLLPSSGTPVCRQGFPRQFSDLLRAVSVPT